jgi:hypothetical protein
MGARLRLVAESGARVSPIDAAAVRIERELTRRGLPAEEATSMVAALTIACGIEAGSMGSALMLLDEKILFCPKCRGTNLHQESLAVWRRREDADGDEVTLSARDPLDTIRRVRRDADKFRHGRRQYLELGFTCEVCGPGLTLIVQQHKGETFVEWSP